MVGTLQYKIGYFGFFLICMGMTVISGGITYYLDEDTKYDYQKADIKHRESQQIEKTINWWMSLT